MEARLRIVDIEGNLLIFANLRDRRSELQYQAALREAADRLRLVTNNIPAWILYVTRDYQITYYNEQFAQSLNIAPDQILAADELFGDVMGQVQPYAEQLFRGEKSTIEFETVGNSGRRYLTNLVRHLVDGEVAGQFVMIRDFTERYQEREELRQKNNLLQIITDNLPGRVTYIANGTELLFWNQPFADLYSCLGQEPPLKTSDIIPEHIHTNWLEHLDELKAGRAVAYDMNVTLPNGSEQHSHFKLLPHMEDGKMKGVVTLALDITELRHTQASLDENLARFQMVADNVPARLAFLDPEGNVLYVNKQLERHGIMVTEAVGRNPSQFLPPDYSEAIAHHFRKALTGEATSFELPLYPTGWAAGSGTSIFLSLHRKRRCRGRLCHEHRRHGDSSSGKIVEAGPKTGKPGVTSRRHRP